LVVVELQKQEFVSLESEGTAFQFSLAKNSNARFNERDLT